MLEGTEEKEKCRRKLSQMKKYIPFIDYVIDKIHRKDNGASVECQLSKFRFLRSLIAEQRDESISWDSLVQIEDVIEKLILKFEFKDHFEKSSSRSETDMASFVSSVRPPAAPGFASTMNNSQPKPETKSQEFPSKAVDLIMKTLKFSVDKHMASNAKNLDVADPEELIPGRSMETDLDKDLDGFDLTNVSETESGSTTSGKASPHVDVLSSSREKLLKSLQTRLFPSGPKQGSDPKTASSPECKSRGDSEKSESESTVDKSSQSNVVSDKTHCKQTFAPQKRSTDKNSPDPVNSSGDFRFKQKLKEKLSTDICEVYRVPGKSVGGSLRSLKESKEKRISGFAEEPDPVRSVGKVAEKESQRGSFGRVQDEKETKSRRGSLSSEKRDVDKLHRDKSGSSPHQGKQDETKVKESQSKTGKKESVSDGKESEVKALGSRHEIDKLNDEELLKFIKDNVESLPYLAKLEPEKLRETIEASLVPRSLPSLKTLEDFDKLVKEKAFKVGDSQQSRDGGQDDPSKIAKEQDKSAEKVDKTDDFGDSSSNEEDYVSRLIEETTPKPTAPVKKKKGLLDLPMPVTEDLFDDIFSIESFETTTAPPDETKTKSAKFPPPPTENKSPSKQDPSPVAYPQQIPVLCRFANNVNPKEVSFPVVPVTAATDNIKARFQDPRLCRHGKGDFYHFNIVPHEISAQPWSLAPVPIPNDPRWPPQIPPEPKSYAEYKRMKFLEQQRLNQQIPKPESGPSVAEVATETSRTLVEPEKFEKTVPKKTVDRRHSWQSQKKFTDSRGNSGGGGGNSGKAKKVNFHPKERRHSSNISKSDKKDVAGSEDLISPLDKLYGNEGKPKTGLGYGLQKFKIPKKVRECETVSESSSRADETQTKAPEKEWSNPTEERNEKPKEKTVGVRDTSSPTYINQSDSAATETIARTVEGDLEEKTENGEERKDFADDSTASETKKKAECESSTVSSAMEQRLAAFNEKPGVVAKEEITQDFVEALIRKSFQSGEGKLLLAQVKLFEKLARKLNSKKLKTIQKIINSESESSLSSFETTSEEERKKKKSKKLNEKSQQRQKRRKKLKTKKRKKLILTSSSSSCSSSPSILSSSSEDEEESCKNNSEKKKEKFPDKATGTSMSSDVVESETDKSCKRSPASKEVEEKGEESLGSGKGNFRSKGKTTDSNGKKSWQKKNQKVIEDILKEEHQVDSNEAPASKESESKRKPKVKGKAKTELDRLHDDLRNMFICQGVLTATGKRMCRIIKQSGGDVNNLDIVKESAKMVEEEKLKKVQTRKSQSKKSQQGAKKRSRSPSSDKGAKPCENSPKSEIERDPKLRVEPRVVLQRVNLNRFGYGIKLSDYSISFKRMQGRNTALKKTRMTRPSTTDTEGELENWSQTSHNLQALGANVFLPRNIRKFERSKNGKLKKRYGRKKLEDVVENLPLKTETASSKKEKQEEISERRETPEPELALAPKEEDKDSTAKIVYRTAQSIGCPVKRAEMSVEELIGYALEKKWRTYPCKLCPGSFVDITEHYLQCHPDHEVLISRLSPEEARKARVEAIRYSYDVGDKTGPGDSEKRKPNPVRSPAKRYNCRMCPSRKFPDLNAFAAHVSIHTGERRFQCPSKECFAQAVSRRDMKKHILEAHPSSSYGINYKINAVYLFSIYENDLFGFMCSTCNYVQLYCRNLERHIIRQHFEEPETRTIKINMSSRPLRERRKRSAKGGTKEEKKTGWTKQGKKKSMSENEYAKEKENKEARKEEEMGNPEKKSCGAQSESEKEVENVVREGDGAVKEEDSVEREGDKVDREEPESKEVANPSNDPESENCEIFQKIQVGPLEAQVYSNSSVLYECYVKGCLFSTKFLELFEVHIKISHSTTKWDGSCEICVKKKGEKQTGEKPFQLLTALKHLKLHQRAAIKRSKLSPKDLAAELELEKSECLSPGTDTSDSKAPKSHEDAESNLAGSKSDACEPPYPPKPLLRVRNLLGDRLSTPKDGDIPPAGDDSSMFTIENVRSLTEAPAENSELKIEQVCSLKDYVTPSPPSPKKTILVRSCPTRKIAIRPEPPTMSVDVGHASGSLPPVVLSPISSTSPIRIISSSASANPQFPVKPVVVTGNKNAALVPVIVPAIIRREVTTGESPGVKDKPEATKNGVPGETSGEETLPNVELVPHGKTPPSLFTIHHPKCPPETGEPEDGKPPKFCSSGRKSVKDAKIYQEMLAKPKLCHLFKCMGVECSFTCNSAKVFSQHIGLHEAQRRVKGSKYMKSLRYANKTKKAFYWQQCAYCCEVLTSNRNSLSEHILEEHGHCMYQCAFCFYRAVSHSYVEIHQSLAHWQMLKTTPRMIYKCKQLKKPPTQAAALEKYGRKQSVRPYLCDLCGRKFFITHEFTSHLAKEHQSVTAYSCHICKNRCFKVNRLINHYKLHSYSTYQCPYCLHGAETEKEMVFHLCSFHFSQPAVMYIRAFASGKSFDEEPLPKKRKKHLGSQLESLKIIVHESDTPDENCIVEADGEDDASDDDLDKSDTIDGINRQDHIPPAQVTPLIKELAAIGKKNPKNLTLQTLLPNAQFSTDNESDSENCSVLISSGLSIPLNESEVENIPLGQLPLSCVSVQYKQPESSDYAAAAANNVKTNDSGPMVCPETDKTSEPSADDKKSPGQTAAVHKLPPVVLGRSSSFNRPVLRKKLSEQSSTEGAPEPQKEQENVNNEKNISKTINPKVSIDEDNKSKTGSETTVTDVVVLSSNSEKSQNEREGSAEKSRTEKVPTAKQDSTEVSLKPPIIRVADFLVAENRTEGKEDSDSNSQKTEKTVESELEKSSEPEPESEPERDRPSSPDIIILGQKKPTVIETVVLDSDDEKENDGSQEEKTVVEDNNKKDETIRKEMEQLRRQITCETDSLLVDEHNEETTMKPTALELSLKLRPEDKTEEEDKSSLSPVEESITSLNKKLEPETEDAAHQKRRRVVTPKKAESETETEVGGRGRPRTRFGSKEEQAKVAGGAEGKSRKFKEDLSGKDLFLCGNEKCHFAAEDDSSLKDHLYVCDFSRESSALICPHCSKQMKQFNPYVEHLRYHGEKKLHCGLCSFASAVELSISKHLKIKHKCCQFKILQKESKEGHLVYYPKNFKVEKVDFEVNGYSPGDEDKLPLQSVYQVNVKCAKCPYFTKVRSNMVRHLKIHVKSAETEGVVVVPSTAPTNPVPCLESKERMFDKMTNLAASSQLAQAKEKSSVESLSPEEEAKLPRFVPEQLRYKCCLPDCNYITVDDGMLKHHIKALHDEITYYSCPHCENTVHVDVRHVVLDKIGHHLKYHDTKLYKCGHCVYFHFQKNIVEKHAVEKHPERKFFVHTVREPKPETGLEDSSGGVSDSRHNLWKCGMCQDFQSLSKPALMDHLAKVHDTKSKYKCKLCSMKGNHLQTFMNHFSSRHPKQKMDYHRVYYYEKVVSSNVMVQESGNSSGADSSNEHFDTTPLWQRGAPRVRHIRGILIEEEEIKTKKSKRASLEESEADSSKTVKADAYYCPLCLNKKKPFFTRNENCFRTHLYQELNYQQYACILCGKMFVDRRDFEKHHSRVHADKEQTVKLTKEDREIQFWVDQVIAKQKEQMEERKRQRSLEWDASEGQSPAKRKKEG